MSDVGGRAQIENCDQDNDENRCHAGRQLRCLNAVRESAAQMGEPPRLVRMQ